MTGLVPALCRADGCEWQSHGMNWWLVCWGTQNFTSLLLWFAEQSAFSLHKYLESGKDEEASLLLPLAIDWCCACCKRTSCILYKSEKSMQRIPGWAQISVSFTRRVRTRLSTAFPQLEMRRLNCIHWQDEKCVMFCLALYSKYPNLKQCCLFDFCFFLCLLALRHTHLQWEAPSLSVLALHLSHPCFPLY